MRRKQIHKTKVKTLWRGTTVSVNEFEVQKGIKSGGLEITHNDKTMFISVENLIAKKEFARGPFKDKWNPKKFYSLVDFKWEPNNNHKQDTLI